MLKKLIFIMAKIKKISDELKSVDFNLRHLKETVEDIFPKHVSIYTTDGSYKLVKSDLTREHGILRCFYYHNTPDENHGDVTVDGEPDTLAFDIHVLDTESGRRLKIDLTYGDSMKYEFSIESPDKVKIFHYNGIGSRLDSDTHFGLTKKSIQDFIKVFEYLNPKLKLKVSDFKFLDKYFHSHTHNESIKLTPLSGDQKILVVNNGRPTGDPFMKNILNFLKERGIEYEVASNTTELKNYYREGNIVGMILSGSDFRILRDGDSLSRVALKNFKCPTLGICFGFQSICKNFGGEIKEGKKLIHGHYKLSEYQNHHLFKGLNLEDTKFSFSFRDFVDESPQGFKVLAKLNNIIAAIGNEQRRTWGVMFNPEDLERTYILIDNFMRVCHPGQAEAEKIKKGLF